MVKGYVNNVIKSSIVDGPGNRIAIFMQGCNFNCWYCHNPETINLCNNCRACISKCKYDALDFNTVIQYNKSNCIDCNECVSACEFDTTPKVLEYSARQLFQEIVPYFDFVDGITFSGGEALLQQEFILEVIKLIKEVSNINCMIDTNGSIEISPELITYTDKFILDIKQVNADEHIKLTGCSNEIVLENFKTLNDLDKLYEVRTVLYPGYSHNETIEYVINNLSSKTIYKQIEYHETGVRAKFLSN